MDVSSGPISVRRTVETVPAVSAQRRTFHVQDRRTEVAGYVHRTILRNALGESYTYELVPAAVPNGNGYDVAYMLILSTPSPYIGEGYVSITTVPFDHLSTESVVQEYVRSCLHELRTWVAGMLASAEGNAQSRT